MTWEEAKASIVFEVETDGRWIAEATALPGVMAYGRTAFEAWRSTCDLAREVMREPRA